MSAIGELQDAVAKIAQSVGPSIVGIGRGTRGSGVVIAGVNPGYQRSLRQSLPALNHRTLHQC